LFEKFLAEFEAGLERIADSDETKVSDGIEPLFKIAHMADALLVMTLDWSCPAGNNSLTHQGE
jgi:hypothetical protein